MGSLYALFAAFVLILMSLTSLGASLQHVRAINQAKIAQYLPIAQAQGELAAQNELIYDVQNNGTLAFNGVLATATPAPVCGSTTMPNGAPCPYTAVTHGTYSGSSVTGGGTNQGCYQFNYQFNESCFSYLLTTSLMNASTGAVVASRSFRVSYRLFNVAPYAVIAGGTQTSGNFAHGEGDIAGCDPANPSTTACGTSDVTNTDTRNHSYAACQNGYVLCSGQSNALIDNSQFSNPAPYQNANSASTGWKP
jgi:hypothetical protein